MMTETPMPTAAEQPTAPAQAAPLTPAEQSLRDYFVAFSGAHSDESLSLRGMRAQAWAEFAAAGLPHRRIEEWKYTDLRARLREAYPPASGDETPLSADDLKAALGALGGLDTHLLVFINGACVSGAPDWGADIEVMPLAKALEAQPAWFADLLGKVNPQKADPVCALNTAFMRDGAAIRISGTVEKPVHLLFINRGDVPASVAPRNLISIEAGARASIIEQHITLGANAFQTMTVTEMALGQGARGQHIKLLDENPASTHLASWGVALDAGADYQAVQLTTGAGLARNQIFLRFAGEGASAHINGAVMGRGGQHCDTTLVIDHAVPSCTSRELIKAVLDDDARAVFQGKVIVRPGAQKTDGKQMAQALLLSERAEFDSKPELEIYADDVICGHGSTSGEVDEDLMFYLRSRGIPEREARALLITGFIGEVFDLIEDERLRDTLMAHSQRWLRQTHTAGKAAPEAA